MSLALLLISITAPARAATQAPDPASASLGVRVIAQVERDNGERVEMTVDSGSVLRSGDGLQIRLQSSRDAYVYVVAYGASGRIQLLRPFSGESRKARLPGGKEEVFPAKGVFLPLDDVTGRETLFVLALDRPMNGLGPLLRRAQESGDVEGAHAALQAVYPEMIRIDIRHIGQAPLIGLEFAGSARVSEPLPPEPDATTSRAGRGGVVSIPSVQGYQANSRLERGEWLGSYEEEGVLSSVGSRVPGVDPPPAVDLPAAAARTPAPSEDDGQDKTLRERLGELFGRWSRDDGDADNPQGPVDEPASGVDDPGSQSEAGDAANEASSRPVRGGDN